MADGVQYAENGDIMLEAERVEPPPPADTEDHYSNLLDVVEPETEMMLGSTLTEELAHDLHGRADWEKMAKRYIDALGIGPESKPDDYEYEFSDTSDHPLLTKSLTNFQAKALAALMPSPARIAGTKPGVDVSHIEDPQVRKTARRKLVEAAQRVEDFYNWYLLDALPAYEEDTDQIIHDCGLHGVGFRRITVDTSYQNAPVRAEHVALEDLILSYDAKNFRDGGRITHRRKVSTTDLVRGMQSGAYAKQEVVAGVDLWNDALTEARDEIYGITRSITSAMSTHTLYDVFTYLFLRGDEHPGMIARPYIVTIHQASQKVLSIRRNWHPEDPDENPLEHFAGYVYSPGRNALTAIGLGALLTNITMALRKAQRRGLDAAYLANHPSGFITGGFSIRDDSTPFVPGELRPVDVGNGDIRQSILLNPFQGPDAGLLQLYDRMHDAGKELGNIASIDFASMMKSGVAAGPALAAYDESTEFQTSVHRRLYRGHATELRIIHERMRDTLGGRTIQYKPGFYLQADDLFMVDVVPAMKPGHVSRQRALMEAQAVYETAKAHPDIVNIRTALTRLYEAMSVAGIDDLLIPDPAENPPPATDPVNEYMRVMKGEPLRAAPIQNHRAHIEAHTAQMQGLQNSALTIEMGQAVSAALAAHIAEHEALDLMVQVSAQMGIPLEMLTEGIPPEMEAELAPQLASVIVAIENARRPKDEQDPRIVVETIRAETKQAIETMKNEQAALNREANRELAIIRETSQTYRNITDNYYAMDIANLKVSGTPLKRPETPKPPALRADTPVPRFNMEPR